VLLAVVGVVPGGRVLFGCSFVWSARLCAFLIYAAMFVGLVGGSGSGFVFWVGFVALGWCGGCWGGVGSLAVGFLTGLLQVVGD